MRFREVAMSGKTRKITLLSLCVSVAMILSYVEFLLPPIWSAVPGIKLGLANIMIIFVLFRFGSADAALVSVLRLVLSSLLFGSVMTFAYSAAGAILSLSVMIILKKCGFFSTVGVSIGGGVFHNLGQVLMAILLLGTREIGYYMIVLTVTGTVSGIFVGICGALMLKYVKKA